MKKLKALVLTLFLAFCIFPVCGVAQVGYGIVVDNTLSLMNALDTEVDLAKEVVKSVGADKGNYISYFAFATDPISKNARLARGVQCTSDIDTVNRQLDQLFVVSGQTMLIDGILDAVEQMGDGRPASCPILKEKKVILITDGEDRASTKKSADLISNLKSRGVKVYIIGLVTGLTDERGFLPKSARQAAREFIDLLATETGGNVVYPKKKQATGEIVKALLDPKTKK